MTKDRVKDYTLYKLRFWIGYGLLALLTLGVFTFATLYVPGGITPAEEQSALTSASIRVDEPTSWLLVDAPYHMKQKLSLWLFDLSSFSIKLPSLIIAFATTVVLVLLLGRRFSHTVGILTAGLIVVSAYFISYAATGTPEIMMVAWPAVLLCLASFAFDGKRLRTPVVYAMGIVAALSLFTPFMLYTVPTMAVAALLHPRIRYVLRKSPPAPLYASLFFVAVALGIIVWATIRDTSFVAHLLWQSASFSTDLLANSKLILKQTVDFSSTSTEQTGMLAPVFGLSIFAFIAMGTYHLFKWRHSALSYLVLGWWIVVLPIIAFNPSELQLLVVPVALMIASGISGLLNYWYRLFPKNPYARVFALVPVTILFACTIIPGAMRYFYSYHYYAPLANAASSDITLVARELDTQPQATLLVAPEQRAFYQLYLDTHERDTKLVVDPKVVVKQGTVTTDIIATHDSSITKSGIRPQRVVASSKLHQTSDRVYIYKKTEK